MFGSRKISYLAESIPDFTQPPFPNLENSGNMSAFNTFNFNFLGNSQQLFMPADLLGGEERIEAADPRHSVVPTKNLF